VSCPPSSSVWRVRLTDRQGQRALLQARLGAAAAHAARTVLPIWRPRTNTSCSLFRSRRNSSRLEDEQPERCTLAHSDLPVSASRQALTTTASAVSSRATWRASATSSPHASRSGRQPDHRPAARADRALTRTAHRGWSRPRFTCQAAGRVPAPGPSAQSTTPLGRPPHGVLAATTIGRSLDATQFAGGVAPALRAATADPRRDRRAAGGERPDHPCLAATSGYRVAPSVGASTTPPTAGRHRAAALLPRRGYDHRPARSTLRGERHHRQTMASQRRHRPKSPRPRQPSAQRRRAPPPVPGRGPEHDADRPVLRGRPADGARVAAGRPDPLAARRATRPGRPRPPSRAADDGRRHAA
jgi:hypothetical protein